MVNGMQLLQPLARHMRIDLRSGDIGMSEQHLHHPEIRPVIQQMRRECVP